MLKHFVALSTLICLHGCAADTLGTDELRVTVSVEGVAMIDGAVLPWERGFQGANMIVLDLVLEGVDSEATHALVRLEKSPIEGDEARYPSGLDRGIAEFPEEVRASLGASTEDGVHRIELEVPLSSSDLNGTAMQLDITAVVGERTGTLQAEVELRNPPGPSGSTCEISDSNFCKFLSLRGEVEVDSVSEPADGEMEISGSFFVDGDLAEAQACVDRAASTHAVEPAMGPALAEMVASHTYPACCVDGAPVEEGDRVQAFVAFTFCFSAGDMPPRLTVDWPPCAGCDAE